MLRYKGFCNESFEKRKIFSSLAGWKKFVWDSGYRFKLQNATDPYNWIAFSDTETDSKGFFKSIHPYIETGQDLSGSGWALA